VALDRAIEGTWLACAIFVPLLIVPDTWIAGFVQVPKVFLLRTAAILLVVLMAMKWATEPGLSLGPDTRIGDRLRASLQAASAYLREHPIMLAAMGVLAANGISVALSPVWAVSLGGVNPGWDGYSFASLASYLVLFIAITVNLRSVVQVHRLFWSLTASSLILSIYGIGQYLGVDPLRSVQYEPGLSPRIWLTFGNAVFAASYLLLTIPLTLGLWQGWQHRFSPAVHIALGIALVFPPMGALVLTLSRGAILSLVFSLGVFVGLSLLVLGKNRARRPMAILAFGAALALIASYAPIPGAPKISDVLIYRLSSITSSLSTSGGGLSNRYAIWGDSVTVFGDIPWANSDDLPEIPELTFRPLRRLVGYGPDLFSYAISQAGNPAPTADESERWRHGHNFLIHSIVEIGLIGVLAYVALVATVVVALFRLLKRVKRGEIPEPLGYLIIGLAASLAGRSLEQMVGKAQIADLTLSWILAGLVAAMAVAKTGHVLAPVALDPTESLARRTAQPHTTKRASPQRTRSALTGTNLALVAVVIITAIFWSQTVFSSLRSAVLLGDAQRASDAGQLSRAGDLLEEAVAAAPSDVVPRAVFSEALLDAAKEIQDPSERLQVLTRAYGIVTEVFQRDPMEFRARSTAARISRQILALDPSFASTAIKDGQLEAALSPWLWRPREGLATAFLQAGLPEAAIVTARQAKILGADGHRDGYRIYTIDVVAKLAAGRDEEAQVAIDLLTETYPDSVAFMENAIERANLAGDQG
jgi:O-antigen ligase